MILFDSEAIEFLPSETLELVSCDVALIDEPLPLISSEPLPVLELTMGSDS